MQMRETNRPVLPNVSYFMKGPPSSGFGIQVRPDSASGEKTTL
jgi:hypothetical protein